MRSFLFLFFCLAVAPISAEPYVPEELEPWVEWVLHAHPDHNCPRNYSDGATGSCVWKRALHFTVGADRLTFTLKTRLLAEANVLLPGDDRYWPQAVRVNGREAVVSRARQLPVVHLSAGVYDITGSVTWRERPDGITIPWEFGLLALEVDGKEVALPTVDLSWRNAGVVVVACLCTAALDEMGVAALVDARELVCQGTYNSHLNRDR